MSYWIRLLIAYDAFLQAISNKGTLGICISTRAYTAKVHGHRWGIWLDRQLNRIQPNHCWLSLEGDRRRAQAVLDELKDYQPPEGMK